MQMQQRFNSIVTQHKLGSTVTDRLTALMLQSVSIDSLYANGFRNWDGNMVLLPLWALQYMAEGEMLTCINNTTAEVGVDEIDDETRGGCIAYGIFRNDIPKGKRS